MAKAILKDVSKETSRSQEMGFAWLNEDGTIHPVDSLARVEMVLEYLAYANSSHGDLELEGPARNGRWLILKALTGTVKECREAIGVRHEN